MKRVVVAVDGSEASREVIDYAVHYANREKDAEMLFLHVVGTVLERGRQFVEASGIAEAPLIAEEVKSEFEEFVRGQIARSGRTVPLMSVTVVAGVPYNEIVRFAEDHDADIIMIGHRGMNNLARFFLGSVASKVVAHAPCSVYVHRPRQGGGS